MSHDDSILIVLVWMWSWISCQQRNIDGNFNIWYILWQNNKMFSFNILWFNLIWVIKWDTNSGKNWCRQSCVGTKMAYQSPVYSNGVVTGLML